MFAKGRKGTVMEDPFGLLSPSMRVAPYEAYARLRREEPVHRSDAWSGWLLTRHADIAAAFRDRRLSCARTAMFARQLPPPVRDQLAPLLRDLAGWALFMDPPDHTRLRALVSKAFTPRVVAQLQSKITELARSLVDEALGGAGEGVFDVVADVANPLPVIVIGDLLGLPRADRHLLKRWSNALAAFLGSNQPTMELTKAAVVGVVELEGYFRDVLAERRRNPGDDLLSALLAAEDKGTILTEQELLSTCSMVLFGGHETTTNLIANGLLCLLQDPAQLALLRAHPEHLDTAVEELMRYESPVQRVGRLVTEDIEVGGVRIPAGDRLILIMGAAHRDPDVFRDPDRLDVTRIDNRHLGFGFGPHYCVGAALGRSEARAAFAELLGRFSSMTLVDPEPQWRDNPTLRGLTSLRVDARR